MRASVLLLILSTMLMGGCHLIFPFEIEAPDDIGTVDRDGAPRADAPLDDRATLPREGPMILEAALDVAAAKDTATPWDVAPPKETNPLQDLQAENDSTPNPACTPSCTGGDTCCDKGSGYQCYPSADQCLCDPASGAPCTGPHPVCCDRGIGKGYVCYGIAQACLCEPTTGEPCKSPYAICCNKGFGYKCDDSCP